MVACRAHFGWLGAFLQIATVAAAPGDTLIPLEDPSGFDVGFQIHVAFLVLLFGHADGIPDFGNVIEAGSHETALQMILDREIDAAAIDSTVLETELINSPNIRSQIRIIETLGPSPIPPWIIRKDVPFALRKSLQNLLSNMHNDEAGRTILATNRIKKFIVSQNSDYDPLRVMDEVAQKVQLLSV